MEEGKMVDDRGMVIEVESVVYIRNVEEKC